jgi:hypothetical protein
MDFPAYSTVLCRVVDGGNLQHPTTGEIFGGSDWKNESKRLEMGLLPLRIENPPVGAEATEWEIVDDPENPGGKLKKPVLTIRKESVPAGYMAVEYEEIPDVSGVCDLICKPAEIVPIPGYQEQEARRRVDELNQSVESELEKPFEYNGKTFLSTAQDRTHWMQIGIMLLLGAISEEKIPAVRLSDTEAYTFKNVEELKAFLVAAYSRELISVEIAL